MIEGSDYTQHKIQPWDGFVYLNPYSSNILKYILRRKNTTHKLHEIKNIVDSIKFTCNDEQVRVPFETDLDTIRDIATEYIDTVDTRECDFKKALSYAKKLEETKDKYPNHKFVLYNETFSHEERYNFVKNLIVGYEIDNPRLCCVLLDLFLTDNLQDVIANIEVMLQNKEY